MKRFHQRRTRAATVLVAAGLALATGQAAAQTATIAVGAVALCAILEDLGADDLTMCDRALREGIVADYLERERDFSYAVVRSTPSFSLRRVQVLATVLYAMPKVIAISLRLLPSPSSR